MHGEIFPLIWPNQSPMEGILHLPRRPQEERHRIFTYSVSRRGHDTSIPHQICIFFIQNLSVGGLEMWYKMVNSLTVVLVHCQTMSQLSYLQYLSSSTAFSPFAACSRYSCSKTAITVAVLGLKPAAKHLSLILSSVCGSSRNPCIKALISN